MQGAGPHGQGAGAPLAGPAASGPSPTQRLHRRGPSADAALLRALGLSAGVHLGLLVTLLFGAALVHRSPPPQRVLTARLVRLGPQRPKDALPQLAASPRGTPRVPRAPAPKKDAGKAAPNEAPAAPAASAELSRAQSRAQARSALARLKREAAGAVDGDLAGDADLAAEGDRYGALVKRCLEDPDHYKIDGVDRARFVGLRALVVVRIQADGRIIGHRLAESPGVVAFEQAIERAVRLCGRVPPPPVALQRELQYEGLGVEFAP